MTHFPVRIFPLIVISWILVPWSVFAGVADATGQLATTDSAISFEGLQIDSIVIINRNIYDTEDDAYDKFMFRLANKFHIRTRRFIIQREVLLKKGDMYSKELAEETERNLRRRMKVYDAWVRPRLLPDGKLLLEVITVDQWSLAGGLSYSREGNETRYQVGAEEENFLGINQFVSFYYYAQSDDDNFVETRFFDNRFFGRPIRVRLDYGNDPVDGVKRLVLSRPFYSLEQQFSGSVDIRKTSGRRDVYDDTLKVGESSFEGDLVLSEFVHRFGRSDSKLQLTLEQQYRFERNYDRKILTDDSNLAVSSFPMDSLYHELTLGANYSRFKYVKMRNIDGFQYSEDFITGFFVTAEYARAFQADFKNFHFDKAGAAVSRYLSFGSSLLFLDYEHIVWFKAGDMFRHSAHFSAKYYNQLNNRMTAAVRGAYVSDWDVSGRNNLLLGGTTGIRGYDKFFRTGNRKFVLNAETRFFTDVKLLSVMLGAAAFVDCGSIWKSGQAITSDNLYASAGVGLRIAFEKSTKNVVRIDLAYSETNAVEFSIGTDQYFFAQR